jgi:hypothetical protein
MQLSDQGAKYAEKAVSGYSVLALKRFTSNGELRENGY